MSWTATDEERSYMLSGDDIKAFDPGAVIALQSNLDDISDIDQLFVNDNGHAYIFFESKTGEGGGVIGHWSLLIDKGGDNGFEFFDPYGRVLSAAYEKYVKGHFKEGNHLLDLLKREGEGFTSNERKYQSSDPLYQTCGRHVLMRAMMDHLNEEEYSKFVDLMMRELKIDNPDDLSIYITEP